MVCLAERKENTDGSEDENRCGADDPRWLTPPRVAERLGVDPQKILAWIRKGELLAVNLALTSTGRPRWHIDPKDLDKFLERRQSKPPPPKSNRKRARDDEVIKFY